MVNIHSARGYTESLEGPSSVCDGVWGPGGDSVYLADYLINIIPHDLSLDYQTNACQNYNVNQH